MDAKKCDACGAFFEKTEEFHDKNFVIMTLAGNDIETDLCASCMKKLHELIFVAEPIKSKEKTAKTKPKKKKSGLRAKKKKPAAKKKSSADYQRRLKFLAIKEQFIKEGKKEGTAETYAYEVINKKREDPRKKASEKKIKRDNAYMKKALRVTKTLEKRNCLICGTEFKIDVESKEEHCENCREGLDQQ